MLKFKLELLAQHTLEYIRVNVVELILLEVIILLDQGSIYPNISQKQALIVNKLEL